MQLLLMLVVLPMRRGYIMRERVPGLDTHDHSDVVLAVGTYELLLGLIHVRTPVATDITVLLVFAWHGSDDFEFAAEDHGETVAADGLVNSRDTCAVPPVVELAAYSVCFDLEDS